MALYEQLKLLYDQGLYSSVTSLASMMLTAASESSSDMLTFSTKYQTYVYYADSLYQLKEFKRAEAIYKKAIQLRKSFSKTKGKTPTLPAGEVTSEVDIKYKMHLCLVSLKQYSQAIAILDTIPAKQRTPCINMALAKLNHQGGNERAAITYYKEVLRECPFAVEASHGLLNLGTKSGEVTSMMVSGSLSAANIDWLTMWMRANYHFIAKEFPLAIAALKHIDKKSILRDNTDVLVTLGEAYYYNGDFQHALSVLERAHCLDPLLVKGMDIYGILLAKEERLKELESLATRLIAVNDNAPEPWIAMGYFSLAVSKERGANKALSFAQKALNLSPRYVEALLLKGTVLLKLQKFQDSLIYFGEAFKMCPFRYEPPKGMIDCYLAMHRTRDAVAIASAACKHLNHSARGLTLYASVLAKDPLSADKAKPLLDKALKQDPTYLNAVYLLASIYEQERLYEKGIDLLKKHIEQQTSCQLHQMLGDFLRLTNETEKALHHFNIALNLDPSNHKAVEGSQRVEQNPESSESYEVDDIADSENEGDLEESEVEAVWSDVEYT
ncbi:anaphase-promoting complex subunit 7 [Caerostris darwini]|uniref:Anaphase-promoting complex subunit 7 n=1 Tax=Caerostris darwini TaxID=1538125 RepID=A0AAV4X6X0_9ARAC|nr:anaphase-promoting complex subunit 7 [Caerostris darwini]